MEIIDKFLNVLTGLDINPLILALFITFFGLWVVTLWIFKDNIGKKINSFSFKNFPIKISLRNKFKIKDLENHEVFAHLDSLRSTDHIFYTKDKEDLTKTKAFQDFIDIKLKTTKQHIKLIINEADESLNPLELRHLIETKFNESNCKVEELMLDRFKEKGVPEKYRQMLVDKFISVRKVAMDNYNKTFTSIFNSRSFNSNYEIINTILFVIHNEAIQIVDACIIAFEHINGGFMDIEY